jgi:hypothetical protein
MQKKQELVLEAQPLSRPGFLLALDEGVEAVLARKWRLSRWPTKSAVPTIGRIVENAHG